MTEPWTEDEDFYLSQGFAIFHDEKQDNWSKIRAHFPFKESRKPSDLQERWRVLSDQLETEDQGTLERIKSASKLHAQTWTYNYEPTTPLPDIFEFQEQFKNLPSLAMKTQFIEASNSRATNENQNINEMCLNNQFDAVSIKKIVQDVLNKLVDDETLKSTLMREFKGALSQKGREFAYEDIERKIKIINEMTDQQMAENEVVILLDYFDKIFLGLNNRLKAQRPPNTSAELIDDILNILMALYDKVKPLPNPNPPLIQFFRDFYQKYMSAFSNIFSQIYQEIIRNPELYKKVMEIIKRVDKHNELDKYLPPQLKQFLLQMKQL
ncbi:hypothetical protein TRFO_11703 [Tritrichomonas foetus]|uniref:Myb-like domain-containing protein n=1 Tax=Tritrichomonas foetus TaxID=1144522 RepID=A0A1J4J7W2_9EUKA|nr:hypothetical protein TRFO_11703 [Tritrichomonas foetus]|eukprot:OHS93509.1 hypothetical protein TRFO_11703 [Tritrichomonas foetus]